MYIYSDPQWQHYLQKRSQAQNEETPTYKTLKNSESDLEIQIIPFSTPNLRKKGKQLNKTFWMTPPEMSH